MHCIGQGRKEWATPLTSHTTDVLRSWIDERSTTPDAPLFTSRQGRPLSRYGLADIVERHAEAAASSCPSLASKVVSPHVLRHTAAMRLLHAGVDLTVIALWLGHESIETAQMHVHADLTLKEKALARITPIESAPARYRPPDALLAFVEAL